MHRFQTFIIALVMAVLVPFGASAADRQQSYEDLAASSDKILLGSVSLRSSYWGDDSRIYTDVVVSPEVGIKGAEEGAVVVRILGGTVGDTQMTVSDGPELLAGDRVLVFLKRESDHYAVVGSAAGSVRASSPDAPLALERAFTDAERRAGARLGPKRGLAGTLVERSAAGNTAEQAYAAQVGCYSADAAKWGSSSAPYKIGSSIPAAWVASINAAAGAWNGVGAAFQLVNNSGSVNEISFADLVSKYGSSYTNTLAVTTTWWNTSTGLITKATIEMNTKWAWSPIADPTGPDVQNVITHEFGHWMRLLDIYSPASCSEVTMWGSAAFGETKKRTLEQADIDGFNSLYPGGSGGSQVGSPTLVSPGNGATGVSTSPTLSWTAASNATSYDVYLGTSPSPGLVTTVSGTTYPAGGLAAGTTYYWRVVAKNASSNASSATFSFSVAAAAAGGSVSTPALTSPANGATGVSTSPTLTWNGSSNATYYDVYFGTSPTPPIRTTVGGTNYQVTGLVTGTTYYWRVEANNATSSAMSTTFSFTAGAGGGGGGGNTVSAPALTSPANGTTGVSTSPTLTWSASSNATYYDIYFGTSPTPPIRTTVGGTSYPITGLVAGTTYYWKVIANNATSSASSATFSFTVGSGGGGGGGNSVSAPALTSPSNGATGVSTSPTLTWTAASNATYYDIYFGTSPAPPIRTTVGGTSYQITGLVAGTTYYWKVIANNATSSASSAVFSFTVGAGGSGGSGAGSTVSTPLLTSPGNGATGVSTSPTLTWTPSSNATYYDIYFGTSSSPPIRTTVGGTSYQMTGLSPGTTYYWKVEANNATSGAMSATFSFTTGSSNITLSGATFSTPSGR